MDNMSRVVLITINEKEEPYVRATELAKHLGYKEPDQVSRIVRRRPDDFAPNEACIGQDGVLYLNYDGAIKVCMFANTEKSRDVREEITDVYKAWRNGEVYSNKTLTPAEQAWHVAKAVMKLAEVQMELERKVNEQGLEIEGIKQDVEQIKKEMNPKQFITDEQASEISIVVRMLGQALSEKSGKNKFAAVYAEMYRKYSITSYKTIPQDKFPSVMRWLQDWYSSTSH